MDRCFGHYTVSAFGKMATNDNPPRRSAAITFYHQGFVQEKYIIPYSIYHEQPQKSHLMPLKGQKVALR